MYLESSTLFRLSWLGSLFLVLGLAGCAGVFHFETPDDSYRLACGHQCLKMAKIAAGFLL